MPDPINPYESPTSPPAAPELPPALPGEMARVANGLRYIFIGAVLHIGNHVVYLALTTFSRNADLLHTNLKFNCLVSLLAFILQAVGGLYCWATPPQTHGGRLITIYSIAALAMVPLRAGRLLNYLEVIPSLPDAVGYLYWLLYSVMLASFLLYSLRLNGFLGQDRLVRRGEIVLILMVACRALGAVADSPGLITAFAFSPKLFFDPFDLLMLSSLIAKLAAVLTLVAVQVMYARLIYATRKAVLASGPDRESPAAVAAAEAGPGQKP